MHFLVSYVCFPMLYAVGNLEMGFRYILTLRLLHRLSRGVKKAYKVK